MKTLKMSRFDKQLYRAHSREITRIYNQIDSWKKAWDRSHDLTILAGFIVRRKKSDPVVRNITNRDWNEQMEVGA